VKNIYGTSKGDTLNGSAADNMFWTYSGNDVAYGKGGDDTFSDFAGGPNAFTGSDKYFGGSGDDFFLTMNGKDTMSGGGGDDDFISYNREDIVVRGGAGKDQLTLAVGREADFDVVYHHGSHIIYEHDGQTIDVRGVEKIDWSN
jgi:Ca2+-binding RTX toxin-like protein